MNKSYEEICKNMNQVIKDQAKTIVELYQEIAVTKEDAGEAPEIDAIIRENENLRNKLKKAEDYAGSLEKKFASIEKREG